MSCIVCEKIKGKKAMIVYEDEEAIAILPSRPAVVGHVKILPKSHCSKLDELAEAGVEHILMVANYASAACFDAMKAQGTNIIINEGEEHLAVDVIPRKEGDGLNFTWKPKQLNQEEFDSLFSRIKDKAFVVGQKEKPAPAVVEDHRPVEEIKEPAPIPRKENDGKPPGPGPVNYMIKNLTRVP